MNLVIFSDDYLSQFSNFDTTKNIDIMSQYFGYDLLTTSGMCMVEELIIDVSGARHM
ncbi:MAG: hypothetical protein ACI8U0_001063, partial [Flavobacteriales bacterium]